MQDKILFAAGLVALFIGLFIGIRTDNVSKKVETELSEAKRMVASLEQEVQSERSRNSLLDQKLQTAARQLSVVEKKLTVSSSWYNKLQDTNKGLSDDIYRIRLSLEEVLSVLPADSQSEAGDKIQELMMLLDEHHAGVTGEAAQSEEPAAAEVEETEAAAVPAEKETAPPAMETKEEEAAAMPAEREKTEAAEEAAEEPEADSSQAESEEQGKEDLEPESSTSEEKEPSSGEHQDKKSAPDAPVKLLL